MRDALAFLTILPVGARGAPPARRSLLAFPLVGLVVGVVWALAAYGASWLWGPWPAAAVVVVADLALTGGLHLDAVADVADGWASRTYPIPISSKVAMSRRTAAAATTIGTARRPPVPSPRRIWRSSRGCSPRWSRAAPAPGSTDRCPARR